MMYLRVILFLFACSSSISAISIVIYKNAQFIPTNTTVKLADLYSINSQDECACQCFVNSSSCLTASYVGLNRSCSLFSTKIKFNWLQKMANMTNASVLTFANESLLRKYYVNRFDNFCCVSLQGVQHSICNNHQIFI